VLADITQGRRVWRVQAPGFGAQLVAYPSRSEMARHSHGTANITVILAGSFEEEIDGHDYYCEPLCVVVKPAGSVHATRTGDTGAHSLVVEIEGAMEDELRRRYGLFDQCRWFHEPCALAPCVLGLCRWLHQGGAMTDGALDGWFARLGTAARAAPRPVTRSSIGVHVRRALEIMRQERAASTADVAMRLGLHPVYLARLFRTRLGCSPGQMRQGLRLGAALDRLVQTRDPLVRVAFASGFADQSHLSRQVKRHAGVPAGVLRSLASGKSAS
jgi:AraC family transcriptional regulator